MKAHRFVLTHDFGFIALNILYMYPEDSGTYTLVVRNAAGEARSVADIDCAVKGSMVMRFFLYVSHFLVRVFLPSVGDQLLKIYDGIIFER